ncbi:hypothetical protein AB0284_14650 [Pseudarthrobacter phenanthrenivorans]|uniref:hypothetical protein n=1 Tax=Pseudarthrobacter phenanthrenivorans TaxID=361575 RepID=UPI00344BB4FC
MTKTATSDVLDLAPGVVPDPEEFVQAAMRWHFDPETGSPFWIERAKSLEFDPRTDVKSFEDLALFPNVTDELRDVPTEMLIPLGFGPRPDVVSVIESGGTTGSPKRLPLLREFADRIVASEIAGLTKAGISRKKHWLSLFPSGPHGAFDIAKRTAAAYGDGILVFGIDLDPRWVKKQIGAGNAQVAEDYVAHVVEQAASILKTQNVGSLRLTAPVLARLSQDEELVGIIREKITDIGWGGASMDADSRYLYRTEIFPDISIKGGYGTTMALGGGSSERDGLGHDDPCIFDPSLAPYVTFSVVDPVTGQAVAYGDQGQIVVNHVSKSFLLPNNAERDLATRIEPRSSQIGDSIADVRPLAQFGGTAVIEGVY